MKLSKKQLNMLIHEYIIDNALTLWIKLS